MPKSLSASATRRGHANSFPQRAHILSLSFIPAQLVTPIRGAALPVVSNHLQPCYPSSPGNADTSRRPSLLPNGDNRPRCRRGKRRLLGDGPSVGGGGGGRRERRRQLGFNRTLQAACSPDQLPGETPAGRSEGWDPWWDPVQAPLGRGAGRAAFAPGAREVPNFQRSAKKQKRSP